MTKNYIKKIFLFFNIFLFSSSSVFINGCSKNEQIQKTTDVIKKDPSIKQAVYTCPMHSEVKSVNKNDKCPKCGMNLVEVKEGSMNDLQMKMHLDKYSLKLTTEPQNIKTGEGVTLNLSLTNSETNQQIKDLDIVHEKILHLIIVSNNLAYFDYIHPGMNPDGSLSVKTEFDKGGDYILFADLRPKGEKESQVFDIPIKVSGDPVENIALTPYNLFETDGYTASMTTEPAVLVANKSTEVIVNLKKNGKDVTDLKNYLGALGSACLQEDDVKMM